MDQSTQKRLSRLEGLVWIILIILVLQLLIYSDRIVDRVRDLQTWLHDLPLHWATILTVIFFAAIIVWAVTRPKEYVYSEAPDRKLWRDLRVWATLIMVIQIAIYLYVGFVL